MPEYIIDKEFKELIPPLQKEELVGLEESIKNDGCRQPITLWGKIIVDGHNRYKICTENRIQFRVDSVPKDVIDRTDALLWIIRNQLHRRNLSTYDRGVLALRLKKEISEKAKEQQIRKPESVPQNSAEQTPIETRKELAKAARTSHDTIHKIEKIESSDTTDEIKDDIRTGKISINKVYSDIRHKEKVKDNIKLKEESKKLETDKKYDIILADPPWKYEFSKTKSRSIEAHYPEMELNAIKEINIPTRKDSVLFLWATSPKLKDALDIMQSWGYEYKTNMVWVKDKIGMGYYARSQHELLLIGTIGKPQLPNEKDRPSSIISSTRKEHSKKPSEVYDLIERMYPKQDYLELFARNKRDGWDSWGNEI